MPPAAMSEKVLLENQPTVTPPLTVFSEIMVEVAVPPAITPPLPISSYVIPSPWGQKFFPTILFMPVKKY